MNLEVTKSYPNSVSLLNKTQGTSKLIRRHQMFNLLKILMEHAPPHADALLEDERCRWCVVEIDHFESDRKDDLSYSGGDTN